MMALKLLSVAIPVTAVLVGLALAAVVFRDQDDDPWDPTRWRGDD